MPPQLTFTDSHQVSAISPDAFQPLPPPPTPDDNIALFLDVDGTLLDFAVNPHPTIDATLHADLALLADRLHGAIALVSGRPLDTLDEIFDWRQRAAAAVHGADIRLPAGERQLAGDPQAFAKVRARAAHLVAAAGDLMLDDKNVGLGIFYQDDPSTAERIAQELIHLAGPDYMLFRGKHGVEIKPRNADKGTALATLLATPPFRGRTPWMVGDDAPDEPAFARANQANGVSVVVGAHRPTQARYTLSNPAAVRALLHNFAHTR